MMKKRKRFRRGILFIVLSISFLIGLSYSYATYNNIDENLNLEYDGEKYNIDIK